MNKILSAYPPDSTWVFSTGPVACGCLARFAPSSPSGTTRGKTDLKLSRMHMQKILFLFLLVSVTSFGVSMNFNGHFRSEGAHYNKLPLGTSGINPIKNYLSARALVQPNLIVDDRFSIRSQWSLLTSPQFTPDAQNGLWVGQGGYVFGDNAAVGLSLSRAWLEWTSDFGIFRIGRVPVSWGYGVLYDAGNGVWDDFQDTMDRFEYRLHLGHIVGALAYSKKRKLLTLANDNDQEFYTIYLQYDNPELEVEGGILYEKQARSQNQSNDLLGSPAPTQASNPYYLPVSASQPRYPLADKSPYPLSNNVVDAYLKKTAGIFTFGGEVAWLTGSAVDYDGDGANSGVDSLNAFGVLATVSVELSKVRVFSEFLYASGDSSLGEDHLNGFVLLNRNRGRSLILGRELLGPYAGNLLHHGSLVVYGDADTFSGVYYLRPGIRVDWSPSWTSGLEVLIARKASTTATDAANLGLEIDLGTDYSFYKNFMVGLNLGLLFPGNGLRVPDAPAVFAVRMNSALKF